MTDNRFVESNRLQSKASQLIPAGCHTYSKGVDQFPQLAPGFIQSGNGAWVTDMDGNTFLDWGMGLRSVSLGYGYPRVTQKVIDYVQKGQGPNFTRPAPVEVELAELLVELIPSAEMVKFSKNGSDVTSAAIRLSRAYTGRKRIAFCKEHPFFSFNDWFIGTTPCNNGIPEQVSELSVSFQYNDAQSLERIFELYPGDVAAVILEPVTSIPPAEGFLKRVRELTHKHGAVLIFDEMISGFRFGLPGAQTTFGIHPDLSTFGKAIGNGFSCAVLAGKRDIMSLGGLEHLQPRLFLLSATNGAETHSLAAAIETVLEFREKNVIGHIELIGERLQEGWRQTVMAHGLDQHLQIGGYPNSPVYVCKDEQLIPSAAFRTLFLQEMIREGVLIPYISISYSHGEREVTKTLEALDRTCAVYHQALDQGFQSVLTGPPVKPVFRKFN
ncbi:glutamate-1-semialdehyde 2,1-aminomutase [Paenibacillus sp. SYP-B3998]|uniref:Glutamate-1-semialdehyde 2,1-aminomutase n=1 Tax=Paenibacillus sp. SYP-B3998 TaxID=2678564 RepID=A0A6G4A216_9BACL|nr:glutamate-1-semialdehyde 2,1-aminomutase [Paenibacillus sp. SYP-B3998]NEW08513.1 glutamate-1-semialdehyde 2,1-aminomutase [Paenibacillus sp. SYP-B3998]